MQQDKREAAQIAEYVADLTRRIHETVRGRETRIDDDLKAALEEFRRHVNHRS